ncbi:hypothetical protein ZOD2009_17855 [Haladaptatus paucihalophilus DX253]|uniref:DUF2795 domain-containing protein n=1 Tax=Haladaptatus paucihalophilus DX253 TaxID=797209 RepID=E7QXN2_HALPU|nr:MULTISPECIES: hypothetical protein [Haladaptatus]EFW90583.1 hypothetical protein ZOD2009_17855 [Haladaptatus paucihalophilus DX253]GKZ14883.1 hypothetical protein HAL_27640 [Haladaptatus sp. T7]SHL57926.1 hypothetical protein SAMN05444342_4185 [Haladaptatus paucihalophilus DX253]
MSDEHHDAERVQENARKRQRDRAERVEDALGDAGRMLGEHKYPTTSEELATEYGDQPLDLPNETETLGSVFDRLVDERYESPEEAREAVYNEISGKAGGTAEYNDEREVRELDEEETDAESETNWQ